MANVERDDIEGINQFLKEIEKLVNPPQRYLTCEDTIRAGDLYLNRAGDWVAAKAVGMKLRYSDFGRYKRLYSNWLEIMGLFPKSAINSQIAPQNHNHERQYDVTGEPNY